MKNVFVLCILFLSLSASAFEFVVPESWEKEAPKELQEAFKKDITAQVQKMCGSEPIYSITIKKIDILPDQIISASVGFKCSGSI